AHRALQGLHHAWHGDYAGGLLVDVARDHLHARLRCSLARVRGGLGPRPGDAAAELGRAERIVAQPDGRGDCESPVLPAVGPSTGWLDLWCGVGHHADGAIAAELCADPEPGIAGHAASAGPCALPQCERW